MSAKRAIILCTLPVVLAACAEFHDEQSLAPVTSKQSSLQKPAISARKKRKSSGTAPKSIVKTQPLKDFSESKPEPLMALPAPEPIPSGMVPLEAPPTEPIPTEPIPSGNPPLEPAPLAVVPPAPVETSESFEPMESTASLSPAVTALLSASKKSGDLDSAAASIERAIRIEPRNATLFYRLALVKLKQSKFGLAEDLAKKSALLAATDNVLKKHCWLLIAHARELQEDFSGAKEAKDKADAF